MNTPGGSFDLEAEMVRWREAMSSHDGMDADCVAELESHLRDAVSALEARGLSTEEAFLVSRRRLGGVDQVAGEYARNEPLRAWRRRAFWMTAGWLFAQGVMALGQSASAIWSGWMLHRLEPSTALWMVFSMGMSLLSGVLAVVGLWWVSRGGMDSIARWLSVRYQGRRKMIQDLVLLFLVFVGLKFSPLVVPALTAAVGATGSHSWQFPGWWLVFLYTAPQVLPGVLLLFLAPVRRPVEPAVE